MSAESAIVVGSAATDHSQKRRASFQSQADLNWDVGHFLILTAGPGLIPAVQVLEAAGGTRPIAVSADFG
jgi:hypothetical protein